MGIKYLMLAAMIGVLTINLVTDVVASVVSTGNFNEDFIVGWSDNHVTTSSNGRLRTLMLDKDSGSGSQTNNEFLFGQIDMQIKLIQGYSAGTVVAFYLQSAQVNRDEIDFEFLGNVTGQPYVLQTNVYADGYAEREQRINLWFDPTEDFHTYSMLWNIYQIVFMVDKVPIRTYRNYADKGVAFPLNQQMRLFISLWNGETWATRGGKDKIDWSKAPFIASFRNYKIDACIWRGDAEFCKTNGSSNWWNQNRFGSLSFRQRMSLEWVRRHYLIYDYCQDIQRFGTNLPKECSLPKYS